MRKDQIEQVQCVNSDMEKAKSTYKIQCGAGIQYTLGPFTDI